MQAYEVIKTRENKIIYRDGDKLVKLFDENYPKSFILNEAINQARVAETGLNIPKFYEMTVIGGRSAIVMEFVEGRTFLDLFREEPGRRAERMEWFVRIQRDVHSRKHLLLTKYNDKLKRKILASDLDASTRYDLSMRLDGMRPHTHVLHGDFLPSNVIVRPDGTPFILDWSHASQGNATADAAKTYLLFRLGGADEFAEEYLDEFCRQMGVPRTYAEEWIPLVAAAQLSAAGDPLRREKLFKWTCEEDLHA